MKLLARIGVGLFVSLLLLAAAAWFLVATETGTRQALRMVSPWLPDGLAPGRWSGPLTGPLVIEGLRYDSDSVAVSINEATLSWSAGRLLAGELAVHELTASGISVELKVTETAEPPAPWEPADIDLPLDMIIESASIRSLTIVPADPAAAPVVVDEASLTGRYDSRGARLDRLTVSAPTLSVDAAATLDPRGDWPASVEAQVSYRPAGRPPLNVRMDARGSLARIDLTVAADAPWPVSIEGHVTDPAGVPSVDLAVTVTETGLTALDPGWPDLRVAGRLGVTGTLDNARLAGDASMNAPDAPPVTLAIKANGRRDGLSVELLELLSGQSALTGRGAVSFAPSGPTVDLAGQWSALRWPLGEAPAVVTSKAGTLRIEGDAERLSFELGGGVGGGRFELGGVMNRAGGAPSFDMQGRWNDLATGTQPVLASPEGSLSFKGTVEAYELVLDTQLDAAPWAQGPASVRASGNLDGVTVQSFRAPVSGGRIRGNGSVSWRDGARITAAVSAQAVDPSSIWPAVPGRVDLDATLSGALSDSGRRVLLDIGRLGGTLIDAPLSGRAAVELIDETVKLKQLAVQLAGNALTAEGTIGAQTTLDWTVEAPDLSTIGAGLAGSVVSSGRIAGAGNRLSLEIDVEAAGIQSGTVRVENAVGHVVIGDKPGDALAIRIDARGLRFADREVATLLVETDGTTGRHNGQVALQSQIGRLSARFAGGYAQGAWSGEMDGLRAEPVGATTAWTLDRPAALTVSAQEISLQQTCLVHSGASVCAGVRWDGGGNGDVSAQVTELAIQEFSPWLPPALDYAGTVSGTVQVTGNPAGVTGDADVRLSPGSVRQRSRGDSDDPELLAWREAGISATLQTGRLTARAGFDLVDAGTLSIDVAVPMNGLRPDADGELTGRLQAAVTEVPLIETLIPDIDQLHGRFIVDMNLAGSLRAPGVSGSAQLSDASAELPRLGLALADTRLSITASGTQINLDGSAKSGEGIVSIGGDFRLVDGRWRGIGTLSGDRFTAVSLPELSATLSPDLTVTVDHRSLLLDGLVVVPTARIEPRDLQGSVQPSADAIVVDAQAAPGTREPWQVSSRVRVTLGDAVTIDAFGLEGKISGSLLVEDKPGKPSTGTGELSVLDATMTAYSQELTVERGRLIFTGGPLASPGVDIRATRKVDSVVVGVDLRGQLARPEATLFSDPSMDQTEALAYLVLGRPLSTASSGDQGVLGQASMRLGLSGAEFLAQEVGRRIGLDAVEIRDASDESQTALYVGKYLSPRLYVSYGLGLFDAFNSVLVRYNLTDEISVQTETGTEIGADIFYTKER